ncbi:MAG: DinB family protein [Dehalococcoidia bacterium]
MNATSYAGGQIEGAFSLLDTAMDGVTDDQYNWKPDAATCNPMWKVHAHALAATDFFVNFLLKGQPPLWGAMAQHAGLPANSLEVWGSAARLPAATLVDYGRQIRASVNEYISTLSDADLERQLDTRIMGVQTVGWVLQLVATHTAGHTGEIATVKGMQGVKGLPF